MEKQYSPRSSQPEGQPEASLRSVAPDTREILSDSGVTLVEAWRAWAAQQQRREQEQAAEAESSTVPTENDKEIADE